MQHDKYILQMATKMVNIDFSLLYPSTEFFVNVNMLIEFTNKGQVIPTRMDIQPYKMSSFSDFGDVHLGEIDVIRIMLIIYTGYVVFGNY